MDSEKPQSKAEKKKAAAEPSTRAHGLAQVHALQEDVIVAAERAGLDLDRLLDLLNRLVNGAPALYQLVLAMLALIAHKKPA